jgi:hypothetical protein
MSLASGNPVNLRRLVDVGLSVNIALPSGSTVTAVTNWINMAEPGATSLYWTNNTAGTTTPPAGSATAPSGPYAATERVFYNIVTTSSTNGNNSTGNYINLYLQTCPTLSNGNYDNTNAYNVICRSCPVGLNQLNTQSVPLVCLANGANVTANVIDTLPPNIGQYLRVLAVNGTNIANAADATVTLQLFF